MQINDLSARIRAHETGISAAMARVLGSGYFVLGPEVKQFEASFAAYLGAAHCVSVANGTDAIEMALRALGAGHGHRVATVANAGMYATTAILAIGAMPFFLDVDTRTHNTTPTEVGRALQAGVDAVVVTHLYGLATPGIREIARICKRKGVPLLEDCAQAHGARVDGKCAGTFGDAAAFSFYPTKNLGALGDGGAVTTHDAQIAHTVTRLRQYGWTAKYQVELAGARNSRLDEMQAAILSEFLPHLDAANARRRLIAARYSARIRHPHVHVPPQGGDEYVAHLYVLRSAQRNALRTHLLGLGIASEVHYPIPDYRQPLFGKRISQAPLEHTERLVGEILTLPCYPEMTDDAVELVITAVNAWQL